MTKMINLKMRGKYCMFVYVVYNKIFQRQRFVEIQKTGRDQFWFLVEPTPLKNMSQLGWWHSQYMEKKKWSKPPARYHSCKSLLIPTDRGGNAERLASNAADRRRRFSACCRSSRAAALSPAGRGRSCGHSTRCPRWWLAKLVEIASLSRVYGDCMWLQLYLDVFINQSYN